MKRGISLLLFSVIIILVLGWSSIQTIPEHPDTEAEIAARQYVEAYGYQVVSYKGPISSYTLSLEDLSKTPHAQVWRVIPIDPASFIGKEIEVHQLIVSNHPLDSYPDSLGSTSISLLFCEGQVLGGTSAPITKEPLLGAPFSLDGRRY
ncbi:hypothetical protein [uncultured Brevibacillus sp.]|uniref:hypothetical protein n=1 Tax=uncultured Brevibacillus sp. TaxID=169970 RepID=UPI0025999E0B|nr:hypothetical protein [uncultured Brevibacillus sp.]